MSYYKARRHYVNRPEWDSQHAGAFSGVEWHEGDERDCPICNQLLSVRARARRLSR